MTVRDVPQSARAGRRELSITILWGDAIVAHRLLQRGQTLTCGDVESDFALPDELAGSEPILFAYDRDGRASVRIGQQCETFVDGIELDLDALKITAKIETSVVMESAPPWRPSRGFAAQALSAVMVLGALGTSAWWIPSAGDLASDKDDHMALMRHYLMAAQERELLELEEAEGVASENADATEGGTGTRAKGEAGSMGQGAVGVTGNRYGIRGPSDPSDPRVARAAALRDAAEFGMIGMLNSGQAADSDAPMAPWAARAGGNTWGGPIGSPPSAEPVGRDNFVDYGINAPVDPNADPVSTFAIDVDTGSFPLVRRSLNSGSLISHTAVRPEEIINYFDYGYAGPSDDQPFAAHVHSAPSPFDGSHEIVRVGIQAKRVAARDRKPAHLVYLVDTSGSMSSPDKMGLVKESLRLLTKNLKHGDTVAICTYAGSVREVLPPTGVAQRSFILSAIDQLGAGGSTAMSSGIALAYNLAERTRVPGHINRVIVLSDGDANVGDTSHETILATIDAQRKKGITLSTVGFGTGNYNDQMMEQLADKGDGNYRYIDDHREAHRAFVENLDGMLEVVAKDVKIQVDFDPRVVKEYRLIGYENRNVADEDFRNDSVDGGEVGAGHNVTAIYDVVLRPVRQAAAGRSWVTVRVRHKEPDGDVASEQSFPLRAENSYASFEEADASFRFATAAAGFAEVLRKSPYAVSWSLTDIAELADGARDGASDRAQLAILARRAHGMGAG
jgi:Ca-activated chloride channel homolog